LECIEEESRDVSTPINSATIKWRRKPHRKDQKNKPK